jgi:lipopolysaccharide export system protein LptA
MSRAVSALAFDFSTGKDQTPTDIEADHGIVCEQEQNKCTAQGHVKVTHGSSHLQADQLTAYFEKSLAVDAKGQQELIRLEASGQVILSSTEKPQKGFADHAKYDVRKGEVTLTGGQLRLQLEDMTITAQDSLHYKEKSQEAIAFGRARVVRANHTIEADELRTYMHKDKDGKLKVQRVVAQGHVIITGPKETVHGEQGEYVQATNLASIEKNVRISHTGKGEKTQLAGQFAEVNLETGQSRLLAAKPGTTVRGKVKILLIPNRS